jgi:hypothetical protein
LSGRLKEVLPEKGAGGMILAEGKERSKVTSEAGPGATTIREMGIPSLLSSVPAVKEI